MLPLAPKPAASSPTWSDVLDNMHRSLDAAIAATDQRAGFLQSATTPAVSPLEEQEWQQRLELVSRKITALPGVTTSYFVPDVANHVPHMEIKWDAQRIKLAPGDALASLRNSKPSIVLARAEKNGTEKREGITMNSFMLQPGEDAIIADKLYDLLKTHSA